MKTLVLTVEYPSRASYYEDWRDAFLAAADFDVTVVNLFRHSGQRRLRNSLAEAELVVVLHACIADSLDYLLPVTPLLQARSCPMLVFIGNELNLPWAPLGQKIAWLKSVQPQLIATQLLREAGEWLYDTCGGKVIAVPHALNPAAFRPEIPQRQRWIDIGVRSFKYLPYVGDDDRNRIIEYFAANCFDPPLRLDISTEQRFDRPGWAAFLNRCRGTVATEAGSSFLERDDATVLAIQAFLQGGSRKPVLSARSPLHRLARKLPYGMKSRLWKLLAHLPVRHEAAAGADRAEDVLSRFFAGRPPGPVSGKCISSRHLDAVGTKTCQIMFPGRYNDILAADVHYIALAPDFSNITDVMARFRDDTYRRAMVDRAHDYVCEAHCYTHRVAQIAAEVAAL